MLRASWTRKTNGDLTPNAEATRDALAHPLAQPEWSVAYLTNKFISP